MHISVRAPLLSAAFNMVRNWIMARPSTPGRLLDDLEQPPRLVARQRPARRDDHQIALLRGAALIVRQELGGAADELAVGRMPDKALDLDGDRLLHLVAHDAPGESARAARPGGLTGRRLRRRRRASGALARGGRGSRRFGRRRRSGPRRAGTRLPGRCLPGRGLALLCAHRSLPPVLAACLVRSTVFRRAILRRASAKWAALGCWPVARCIRSANCSLRSLTSSSVSSSTDRPRSFSRYCLIWLNFIQRTCRFTNAVDTDSLEPARRNASRAVGSATPPLSQTTLPGFTRAT